MVRVPILAVQKGKGIIVELDLEMKQQGTGALFLDAKLYADDDIRQALNTAFSLLRLKRQDVLIRITGSRKYCLCGGSLALPMYLGMYACTRGVKFKPRTFATGGLDQKGENHPRWKPCGKNEGTSWARRTCFSFRKARDCRSKE